MLDPKASAGCHPVDGGAIACHPSWGPPLRSAATLRMGLPP